MCSHKPNSCNSEHDLEHDFWHEGEHQKARSRARFLPRGKAPKSTVWGTKESTKKHDLEHGFWHEGEHQKARSRARFFARGKAPKSTILCTKENTQNNVRPKYKEILFLTVTAIRTDSMYVYIYILYIIVSPVVGLGMNSSNPTWPWHRWSKPTPQCSEGSSPCYSAGTRRVVGHLPRRSVPEKNVGNVTSPNKMRLINVNILVG